MPRLQQAKDTAVAVINMPLRHFHRTYAQSGGLTSGYNRIHSKTLFG